MGVDIRVLEQQQRRSAQAFPDPMAGAAYFIVSLAAIGDLIPAWGTSPQTRDRMLREFWPTEPWVSGTVSSLAARNAAFSWTLEGPPRTCARIQEVLHLSDFGRGWVHLIQKVSTDLYTQDNGAFVEVIRDAESPSAPLLGLAHLDSGRCMRTGDVETPVIYTDRQGVQHKLKWFQVVDFTDMPSPIETMNGMQLCALSRVLRTAQILRSIGVRKDEKLNGRFAGAIHIVSGITNQMMTDALNRSSEESDNKQRMRYQPPVIVGTLDPTAQVRKETIELASLPENFDEETFMKFSIAALALAFNCEYQDLAPLPGGNLGSSQQSTILHMKARGKGPELVQKLLEHKLNFYILPQNVTFNFTERDLAVEGQQAAVRKTRAETRQIDVTAGVITPQVARQMMEDDGDLSHEYLELMQEEDVTGLETVTDEERPAAESESQIQGQPAPQTAPGAAQSNAPGGQPDEATTDKLTKALSAEDYFGNQRAALEEEYEEELAAVLGEVRAQVVKRLRAEVASSG